MRRLGSATRHATSLQTHQVYPETRLRQPKRGALIATQCLERDAVFRARRGTPRRYKSATRTNMGHVG